MRKIFGFRWVSIMPGTMVEHPTLNTKMEGSNPLSGTAREKCKKLCLIKQPFFTD